MFGIFRKKTEQEKLAAQYNRLMQEAFELSRVNRTASDSKYAEADAIQKKMENLPNGG